MTQSVESFWFLDEKQNSGLSEMEEGSNGIVWINSPRLGLICLKPDGTWNTIRLPSLGGVYTTLFTPDGDTIWVAGYSDPVPYFLAHFDRTAWQVYKVPFRSVNKILQLPDKSFLLATELGIVGLIDPMTKWPFQVQKR